MTLRDQTAPQLSASTANTDLKILRTAFHQAVTDVEARLAVNWHDLVNGMVDYCQSATVLGPRYSASPSLRIVVSTLQDLVKEGRL